jgi:hypothetical protein
MIRDILRNTHNNRDLTIEVVQVHPLSLSLWIDSRLTFYYYDFYCRRSASTTAL